MIMRFLPGRDVHAVKLMYRNAPKQDLDKRMFLDLSMSKSSCYHTPHSLLCASGAKSRRRRPTAGESGVQGVSPHFKVLSLTFH